MLRRFTLLYISLILIPLFAGTVLDFKDCCDFSPEHSIVDSSSSDENNSNTPLEHNCVEGCCFTSHYKVVFNTSSLSLSRNFYGISNSFSYSFSKKSNFLPTPYKPPRV